MPLALRYLGHRCAPGEAIVPWYFGGGLELSPGAVAEIPPAGLTIGRARQADLRVASNGIARAHVRIELAENGRTIVARDLSSTNGTSANGVRAAVHRLGPGDVLSLADRFDFEVVELS